MQSWHRDSTGRSRPYPKPIEAASGGKEYGEVRGRSQQSLHVELQPLLRSNLLGPRLIDVGSDELVQRPDDLVVLVGTPLGSFARQVSFGYDIGEQLGIGPVCHAQHVVEALRRKAVL